MAIAQQASDRIAAAVGELRKVDGDQRQRADVGGERRGIVVRREPDADVAAGEQRVAMREPERQRHDRRRAGGDVGERRRVAQQRPAIVDDGAGP